MRGSMVLVLEGETMRHRHLLVKFIILIVVLASLVWTPVATAHIPALTQGGQIAKRLFSRSSSFFGGIFSGLLKPNVFERERLYQDQIARDRELARLSLTLREGQLPGDLVSLYDPAENEVPRQLQPFEDFVRDQQFADLGQHLRREHQQQFTDWLDKLSGEDRSTLAVKVFEGAGPDDLAKVKAWACRVLKNCEIDDWRRNKRTEPWPLEDLEKLRSSLLETSETPEIIIAERYELRRCVAEVVGKLSKRVQLTFKKRLAEKLPYKEIARQMKVSTGTVKSRIAAVHKRLQASCEGIA